MEKLTKEQLMEAYNKVFIGTHSDQFKVDEMKDLIYEDDYWFMVKPKEGWKDELRSYLTEVGYNPSNVYLLNN